MKFGYYLGLDIDWLNWIQQRAGHDMKQCVIEVLFQWHKRSPGGSHEDVVKALKASGYDMLSSMVKFWYSSTKNQPGTF